MLLKFTLPIDPPPSNQAALRILKTKDGRQFIGKSVRSEAKKWINNTTLMLKEQKNNTNTIDVPVNVFICFGYKHTIDSLKESNKTGEPLIYKKTRPDLDNLAKLMLDSIVDAGILKDDSLIVVLTLCKVYAKSSFVSIHINTDFPIKTYE